MSQITKPSAPDSVAIRDLWARKEAIYQEVAHLPLSEALQVIGVKARDAGKEYDAFRAARARGGPRSG